MPRWPWQRKQDASAVPAAGASPRPPDVVEARTMSAPVYPFQRLAREYVYPDYVDDEMLAALAQAKGVVVDPVAVSSSHSFTSGSSTGSELSGSIRTPVSEVGARVTTSASEERSIGQSIEVQRRQTLRWVVDELAAVLRSEGALRDDLVAIPEACENETQLAVAIRNATGAWGLSQIVTEGPRNAAVAESEGEAIEGESAAGEGEVAPAASVRRPGFMEWDPQAPTREQLKLALDTVQYAAGDVVKEAMIRSVDSMLAGATHSIFALVTTMWSYWGEGGWSYLYNGGLVDREDPEILSLGPTPPVMRVPIDVSKLTTFARSRYGHRGPFQALQVLGRIEPIEHSGVRSIIVTPIVILSA